MIGNFPLIISFYMKISSNRLVGFAMHRYTGNQPIPVSAIYAWQLLGNSVYQKNLFGDGSLMLYRPRLYRTPQVNSTKENISLKIFSRSLLI
jgi:hypothetical protein